MNDAQLNPGTYDALAQKATEQADQAIGSARKAADGALDTLQDKASQLAAVAPGTLSRVAAQIDELTRRGMDRARSATETARDQASRAGDRTVGYIRDEPVKSVLIAAAAGAGIAALFGLLARGQRVDRR
jgi:ElaB/YqjD/DUF883 family membrane-anchored ribosome-binding protein